jgi:hypothetical protein
MRQKTLIALAIVTVPVLAAAIFIPSQHAAAVKTAETGPVFPALKDWLSGAAKITVTDAGGTVTLTRAVPAAPADANGAPVTGWVLADKGGYPVQDALIRPIVTGLLALHTTEAKTERPKLYDRLAVDDPTATKGSKAKQIELANGDGASIVKLIVGRRRYDAIGGGDSIYIRKPEDDRAWLAQPAFDVPADAMGWIDQKILELIPDKIKSVVLTPVGGKPLVLERENEGDKLAIRDLPKDASLRTNTPGNDVASTLRYLDFTDVRPAAAVTGAATATVEATRFDGLGVTIKLFDQTDGTWAEITAKAEGDAAKDADEIVTRTKGWAYKIAPQRVKLLETKLADLLTPVTAPAEAPKPAATPAKPPVKSGK